MYEEEDHVITHVHHHFTLPRLEWQELRQIYRQWVHIEDDPLYKSFMQQGNHMTIDLLKKMQQTLESHVKDQCKEANSLRSDIWKCRKEQGDEITNRLLQALKDSNWARQMDYKRFSEIVRRLTHEMFELELKVKDLKEELRL